MATIKQRMAVERMAENGGVVSRAMLDAGYSPMTAQDPKKLTESKGFKEVYAEYGLTDGLIIRALVNDIKKKPRKRIAELNLAADITGLAKRISPINVNIGICIIGLPEQDDKTELENENNALQAP